MRRVCEIEEIFGDGASQVSKLHFFSEFGFQSMPWFSTLKTVFDEKDMHPFSEMMVKRNHHKNGQVKNTKGKG